MISTTHPIREWRNKTGRFSGRAGDVVRQDEFATLAGIVPSHLSQIETGDRKPSLTLAAKLSDLTGIPIMDLATFEKIHSVAAEAAE